MKKLNFLSKLWKLGKLSLVESSENIYNSYLKKSENSLKSASILIKNKLYEDSVSKSYYAIYNAITALLFKTGIKCENHTASILLLKIVFKEPELYNIAKPAKRERIEAQYYVDESITKNTALDLYKNAEDFLISIKLIGKSINKSKINEIRKNLSNIVKK